MAKKLNFEQCELSNDGICENFGCKMPENRIVIQKQLILGFQCDLLFSFSTVLRRMEKWGGGRRVKGPLGPPNHAPLRVYEISSITKSAGCHQFEVLLVSYFVHILNVLILSKIEGSDSGNRILPLTAPTVRRNSLKISKLPVGVIMKL